MAICMGGLCHSARPARSSKTIPTTSRMSRIPTPGQPGANVENNRRKEARSYTYECKNPATTVERPKRVRCSLFRVKREQGSGRSGELELDDSALQADHRGVGAVVGPQFGKDVLDPALDGFFGNRELVCNLLVRISCSDQAQDANLTRS
jgi:hypothetical protein